MKFVAWVACMFAFLMIAGSCKSFPGELTHAQRSIVTMVKDVRVDFRKECLRRAAECKTKDCATVKACVALRNELYDKAEASTDTLMELNEVYFRAKKLGIIKEDK
jgi:hypothetical protein